MKRNKPVSAVPKGSDRFLDAASGGAVDRTASQGGKAVKVGLPSREIQRKVLGEKQSAGSHTSSGVIADPASLKDRRVQQLIPKQVIVMPPPSSVSGWMATFGKGLAVFSPRKLTEHVTKSLTETAPRAFRSAVVKSMDYTFANKDFLKKMAFTTMSSAIFEMMTIKGLSLSTEVFTSLVGLRIAGYVFSEIMWCVLSNKRIPLDELKRVAAGAVEYPLFSTIVDFALKPFFFNLPSSILVKPLYGMSFKDGTPITIESYLKYLAEKGYIIGKEKAAAQGFKIIFKRMIRLSIEQLLKSPSTEIKKISQDT